MISDKEKKITAYHEAGHAILFHVLPDMEAVYTISIIPTGIGAARLNIPSLKMMKCLIQEARCFRKILRFLVGRVAEEIIFGDITTGASNDIKRATGTAELW